MKRNILIIIDKKEKEILSLIGNNNGEIEKEK